MAKTSDQHFSDLMNTITEGKALTSYEVYDAIKPLLQASNKAVPSAFSNKGTAQNAAHILASHNYIEALVLLLANDFFDLKQRDKAGHTILDYLLQLHPYTFTTRDKEKLAATELKTLADDMLKEFMDCHAKLELLQKRVSTQASSSPTSSKAKSHSESTPALIAAINANTSDLHTLITTLNALSTSPNLKSDKQELESLLNAIDKATKSFRRELEDMLSNFEQFSNLLGFARQSKMALLSPFATHAQHLYQYVQEHIAPVFKEIADNVKTVTNQLTLAQKTLDTSSSPRSTKKTPRIDIETYQKSLDEIAKALQHLSQLLPNALPALDTVNVQRYQASVAKLVEPFATIPYSFDLHADYITRILRALPPEFHTEHHPSTGNTPLLTLACSVNDCLKSPTNTSLYTTTLASALLALAPHTIRDKNAFNGNTVFHYYATSPSIPNVLRNHPTELFELLVRHAQEVGFDFNTPNNEGNTPLHTAVFSCLKTSNSTPFTQLLALSDKKTYRPLCNVNAQNRDGHTVLHLLVMGAAGLKNGKNLDEISAAKYGFIQQNVKKLLQLPRSKTPNQQPATRIDLGDKDGQTPFHHAARAGDITCVQLLLRYAEYYKLQPADYIDWVDSKHETALHKAVRERNYEMVTLLVSLNADVNIRSYEFKTPFEIAYDLKDQELMSILIAAGTDLDLSVKASDKKTPLKNYAPPHSLIDLKGQAFGNAINRIMNVLFRAIDLENPRTDDNTRTEREKELAERNERQLKITRERMIKDITEHLSSIRGDRQFRLKSDVTALIDHFQRSGLREAIDNYDPEDPDTIVELKTQILAEYMSFSGTAPAKVYGPFEVGKFIDKSNLPTTPSRKRLATIYHGFHASSASASATATAEMASLDALCEELDNTPTLPSTPRSNTASSHLSSSNDTTQPQTASEILSSLDDLLSQDDPFIQAMKHINSTIPTNREKHERPLYPWVKATTPNQPRQQPEDKYIGWRHRITAQAPQQDDKQR